MVSAASAAVGSTDQADHSPGSCGVLFDDFQYKSATDPELAAHGWNARSEIGGPGVPGAAWPASNVSFVDQGGQKVAQLRATTDGTATGTTQRRTPPHHDEPAERDLRHPGPVRRQAGHRAGRRPHQRDRLRHRPDNVRLRPDLQRTRLHRVPAERRLGRDRPRSTTRRAGTPSEKTRGTRAPRRTTRTGRSTAGTPTSPRSATATRSTTSTANSLPTTPSTRTATPSCRART